MVMKAYEQTLHLLGTLKLKGMLKNLDEELNEAEGQKVSYLSFLTSLLKREIAERTERRLKRLVTPCVLRELLILLIYLKRLRSREPQVLESTGY
jgi:hypothetical protein